MEATGRFRKKVEKDESYQRTIVRLGGLVEQIIRQNNAIDVYEQYFTEEPKSQLKQDTPRYSPFSSAGVFLFFSKVFFLNLKNFSA